MLDENGIEVAIESVPNPENRSCVVISRETERFLNEIHIHKTDARSSKELLDNLLESEEMVSTRFKETWADPCTKETRADSILFTRNKASFYTEEPFQSMRKSGSLFMLILNVEQLWQCQSPRRLRKYVATLPKKNENLVGSRHWTQIVYWRAFARERARDFGDEGWLHMIFEVSTEKRIECCTNKRWILVICTRYSVTLWWYSKRARIGIDSVRKERKINTVRQSFQHQRILLKMTRRRRSLLMISQFHREHPI